MPRHRHRNWHVDAYHAHLNTPRKFTRHITVAGEATHTIAKLVGVDQIYCLRKVFDPHTAQNRAKNLFFVNAHVRRDMVKQSAAHPKAFFATWSSLLGIKGASID